MKTAERQSAASRAEAAYRWLHDSIAAGDLAPGMRVRENEIARRLGSSRTPVREAIRRLEADGLIQHVPHFGAVVATLDRQSVIELYAMREVLEGTAARFAARHASDAEIAHLRGMIAEEKDAAAAPERLAEINARFHAALYHASHNRYLLRALTSLTDALSLLGRTTLGMPGRADAARREHRRLVKAIAGRDEETAEQTARAHIRAAQDARLKMLPDGSDRSR